MTITTDTGTLAPVIPIRPNDPALSGVLTKPMLREYRMAWEILEVRGMNVYERAAWVMDHADYREYLNAYAKVIDYEGSKGDDAA